jgi:hypothetical protein
MPPARLAVYAVVPLAPWVDLAHDEGRGSTT